jgi:hypothetical protein
MLFSIASSAVSKILVMRITFQIFFDFAVYSNSQLALAIIIILETNFRNYI